MKRLLHRKIYCESQTPYELSDKEILNRFEAGGIYVTTNPQDAIYVLRNGMLIDGEVEYGVRGLDHRCAEYLFDDIDRYDSNFWNELFLRTGMIALVPETSQAIASKRQSVTSLQHKIIKELGYQLIRD